MRKRQKNKKRSCALCKPHKTGHSNRWTKKEEILLKEWEKMLQRIKRTETPSNAKYKRVHRGCEEQWEELLKKKNADGA